MTIVAEGDARARADASWHPPRRPAEPVAARRAELIVTAAVAGAVVAAGWPIVLGWNAAGPLVLVPLVAHVAGMLAGYGVLVLVGMMARVPVLEHGIGADRMTRWHRHIARAVMALIVVHAWAATESWASSRHQSTATALRSVLGLPGLVAATIGTVVLVVVAVASIRLARRRLSYERWHAVHLLAYVGVALAFTHQLAGPDLAGHRALQVGWALMYVGVFGLVVHHRVLTPLRRAQRHRMRVTAVTPESRDVVSIDIAGFHLDELDAQAGQFFRWRFLAPDHWRNAHPFSLSAAPTNSRLRLTVKALGDGSTGLQLIEPGTWVVAEGPYGAMTPRRRTRADVLLIAGGVGITPIRALFEALPLGAGQDLTLLYRTRPDGIVFRQELDAIARRRGAHVHYLVDERTTFSPAMLVWFAPNLVERDVYLCGPPGMTDAVRTALRTAGLPPEQLHEERFGW